MGESDILSAPERIPTVATICFSSMCVIVGMVGSALCS